ncbi:class I SAM-dependent methyltransferase [Streptacidiphilus sp. P02-A3a]|uniref:class I SAM-dependent methyltransferase n=1 Tax=Streptacidiphilus sp. P02-A3a TaxID=2704468 RepID=UPI0015FD1536|nr:class I SAM-dependent methyltransferase [Streptacidiphilus sp. P02-A3a]QMU71021.1 class I SAM-dependent methyltransferase [Streptacidiphilus sp. P02-A3a]
MRPEFSGEVAEHYAKFRRGYPPEVLDALQTAFALGGADTVLDLGCGTGQLAVPLAARVRAVVGMDPEPDMLRLAERTAAEQEVRNATWMLGADTDVPALGVLLGPHSLGMTVIGNALHWMRHETLFAALRPLTRAGGGIAVVSNGTPLWLQDSDWSRALRTALEQHFGLAVKATCGTDAEDRDRYARALTTAGFGDVREITVDYTGELTFEQLIGGVYSAVPEPVDRADFTERVRRALPQRPAFTEAVRVIALVGKVGQPGGS